MTEQYGVPPEMADQIARDLAAQGIYDPATASAMARNGRAGQTPDQLAVIRVADVKAEPVRWLWPGYVPLGMVAVIDGHPKLGKSTLCLDLGARVTTGSPMPDGAPGVGPANVVVLSAEDSAAHVIRPRLDAAGADPARVVLVDHVPDEGGARDVELPGDLARIEALVRAEHALLVICDPLMAYLGANIDAHRDQDVRRALRPFKALAERTGAAFLIVRHYNKAGERNPILRGGGSIGISGAARSVLMVAQHPDDETRRVFALAGGNLAPDPPALAYRIVNDELHATARIVWEGPTEHRARDLLADRGEHGGEPVRAEAEKVLREILADGPVPARKVKALARDAGVSDRTLDRAREAIGAVTRREGFGPGASYLWELPGAHARQPHGDTDDGEHGEHEVREGGALLDPEPDRATDDLAPPKEVKFRPTHRCTKCNMLGIPPRIVAAYPHTGCGGTWQPIEASP